MALETKVKQLEALVAELRPGEDFSHRVGKPITRRNWMQLGVSGNIDTASSSDSSPPDLRLPAVDSSSMDPDAQEETFDAELDIISKLKDLVIEHKRIHLANFYGSSSSQHLIANALELQNTSGQAPSINIRVQFLRSLRTDFWCERPVGYIASQCVCYTSDGARHSGSECMNAREHLCIPSPITTCSQSLWDYTSTT